MKPYLAEIVINLKLTMRDKMVVFFNYLFPLIFFFMFASLFRVEQSSDFSARVVTMVLVIGILGNGFFGAGVRAVAEREANILRRFKVAPISAGPILVSSLVTGTLSYLPAALLIIALAHFMYGMPWPQRPISLFLYVCLGLLSFRALGMMIASVVNSMQESQIATQLMYLPMLFLSGASIPVTIFPVWLQSTAQFLPATHLFTGLQAILEANESIAHNWRGALALIVATVVALFLGMKLFRWEKEQKISSSGRLWLAAVLLPFLALGGWEMHSSHSLAETKALERAMRRSRTLLIRDARIFIGDGNVIENGSVLVRNGKIAAVYGNPAPDAKQLKAELIEAAGKTLLPGLIDVDVHLSWPGGVFASQKDYDPSKNMPRALAAYLYCGVTAVRSAGGDPLDQTLKVRERVNSGERLGAELFVSGPLFTTHGGYGMEYQKFVPAAFREQIDKQMARLPATAAEARAEVDELKRRGVDGIEAALDSGVAGHLYNRMDPAILQAIVAQAHADGLSIVVHTGASRDVDDAVAAGANAIEHGSFRDMIPDQLFARMRAQRANFDPALSTAEAMADISSRNPELLEQSLAVQVAPPKLIDATSKFVVGGNAGAGDGSAILGIVRLNLEHAARAGVTLVTGTGSGDMLLVHGPAVHREMQLWVADGLSPSAALIAATSNAARLLRAEDRMGLIAIGREANLLLVDGNPLQDIRQTTNIQQIIFHGEEIDRA